MRPLFPAAKHNRFSHSLGVYKLGKDAAKGFRQNAQEVIESYDQTIGVNEYNLLQGQADDADPIPEKISDDWWDKYELLFSLACLLHDCAHAPYSHTYEFFYEVPMSTVDEGFLNKLQISEEDARASLKGSSIHVLDRALLAECPSKEFVADYKIFRESGTSGKKFTEINVNTHKAAPHEKLSAAMIGREYRSAISEILQELLIENPLVCDEALGLDIEFMARCVIGMHYQSKDTCSALERSIKNCFISLLNSNMLDVDGLDYMVRDAYNSGIDNGKVDYQRFFRSLTITPVEVFYKAAFDGDDISGTWLAGTTLASKGNTPNSTFSLEGKFTMNYVSLYRHGSPGGADDDEKEPDWFSLKNQHEKMNQKAIKCVNRPDTLTVIEKNSPEFNINCESAVKVLGKFKGVVSGKRIVVSQFTGAKQNPSDDGNEVSIKEDRIIEYVLVYDKACISAIEHAITSRNFEYKWVYSHPKVVYYSSFLLCYLLRLSARYICCKGNADQKGFDNDDFDLISCDGCSLANEQEPDFLIPKLLGFNTYVSDLSCESIVEDPEGCRNPSLKYRFYRSSDSDIRALFKSVDIDNKLRGKAEIASISKYFKAFFARDHQKTLWKTFNEYQEIFFDFDDTQKANIWYKMIDEGKTSQKDYQILDRGIRDIFEKRGLMNPVAVKAKLKVKEIDRYNTLIKTSSHEVTRFADVVQERVISPKNEFFYVYYDLTEDRKDRPTNAEIKAIFQEIAGL